MNLTLIGHDDRYAVEQLQLALFPEGTEGEAISSLHRGSLWLTATTRITVDGKTAIVEGVESLSAAPVRAVDLRAGAAMIIAALATQGRTEIEEIHHIERGYDDIVGKLRGVGADIRKINIPDPYLYEKAN